MNETVIEPPARAVVNQEQVNRCLHAIGRRVIEEFGVSSAESDRVIFDQAFDLCYDADMAKPFSSCDQAFRLCLVALSGAPAGQKIAAIIQTHWPGIVRPRASVA